MPRRGGQRGARDGAPARRALRRAAALHRVGPRPAGAPPHLVITPHGPRRLVITSQLCCTATHRWRSCAIPFPGPYPRFRYLPPHATVICSAHAQQLTPPHATLPTTPGGDPRPRRRHAPRALPPRAQRTSPGPRPATYQPTHRCIPPHAPLPAPPRRATPRCTPPHAAPGPCLARHQRRRRGRGRRRRRWRRSQWCWRRRRRTGRLAVRAACDGWPCGGGGERDTRSGRGAPR